ncbi:Lpg1974 family pore-forming outer membrane protein [Legionella sp. km772]|uniref:Lpg1974 family pore-forming outer membrane protein n=1 Tax=Legionella sp. km772 TaxID=2498111 RepID=UPI000F8C6564|nr:Lpg1974 family pore-forming outer membrane protein [Legionella sp. km772]RUR12583.1 hypothetical protein ELY15_04645 [Legionella sp. km772]
MSRKLSAYSLSLLMFLEPLAHAGTLKNCDKDGLACEKSSFEVGVTALYLQAFSSSLPRNSVNGFNSTSFLNTDRTNTSGYAPWDWGGILDGRYHFSDNNDLSLSWMSYSVGYRATDISHRVDNFGAGLFTTDSISVGSGRVKLNSVNAEFGQTLAITPRSIVRLFAGVQYLNVQKKSTGYSYSVFATDTGPAINTGSSVVENKYDGVGPRLGLDANYKLKGNFSVFANSAATILLARRTLSSSGKSNNSSRYSTLRRDIAVPELEAKLGLSYSKPLANGTASISAGWSVINYFNLLDDDRNNLTLSGPFLQGRWVG